MGITKLGVRLQQSVSVSTDGKLRHCLKYLKIIKGTWIEGYVAWKRRGGSHGRITSDHSVGEYAYCLWRLEHYYNLDLHTADLEAINLFLDRYRAEHQLNGYVNMVSILKDALHYLKRKELCEEIRIPKRPSRNDSIREQILSSEDVEQLISKAPTLRDRLMFELFYELGNRRGEMANLRIKDVQFDQYGAILWLRGKTGVGSRRVYRSVPDLREYLNNHPEHKNPEAPLLFTVTGKKPLGYSQIYNRTRQLTKQILGRHVKPHQFRHTRATEDAKYFTDREMMKLNRWSSTATIGVYTHLSNKDVEDKDLVLHGLRKREEITRPIAEIQKCTKCQTDNAPIAIFCNNCGATLTNGANQENEQLRNDLTKITQDLAALRGQFETAFEKKITNTT